MKNRRNIVIAFLLCACLLVGVGYAALTTNLFINGSSIITDKSAESKFDADIQWMSADSTSDKVKAELDASNDTITITADGLNVINEEITVTCVMENLSADINAWVTIPFYNTAGDAKNYIEVTRVQTGKLTPDGEMTDVQTKVAGDGVTADQFYLAAKGGNAQGGQVVVKITFKLVKSFVPNADLIEVKSAFNLNFVVEAIDNI